MNGQRKKKHEGAKRGLLRGNESYKRLDKTTKSLRQVECSSRGIMRCLKKRWRMPASVEFTRSGRKTMILFKMRLLLL